MFRSALGPDAALTALAPAVAGFDWAIRESEHQGRYVNGTDAAGVRVRLIGDPLAELELYLPGAARGGPIPEAVAAELVAHRVPALLARIGASDIQED